MQMMRTETPKGGRKPSKPCSRTDAFRASRRDSCIMPLCGLFYRRAAAAPPAPLTDYSRSTTISRTPPGGAESSYACVRR
jgi:hypothetical protein